MCFFCHVALNQLEQMSLDVSSAMSPGKKSPGKSPAMWAFQAEFDLEILPTIQPGGDLPDLKTQENVKQLIRQKQTEATFSLQEEELYRFLSDSGLSNCDSPTQMKAVQKWRMTKAQDQQRKEFSSWWWLKAVAIFSSKRVQVAPA
jgi:hypothetical protein